MKLQKTPEYRIHRKSQDPKEEAGARDSLTNRRPNVDSVCPDKKKVSPYVAAPPAGGKTYERDGVAGTKHPCKCGANSGELSSWLRLLFTAQHAFRDTPRSRLTHTHMLSLLCTQVKSGRLDNLSSSVWYDPQSQPARTQQWLPLFQDAAFSGALVKSSQLCASEHQDGFNDHIDTRFPRLVSVRRPVRLRDHGGTESDNGIGLKGAVCQGKDEVGRGEGGRISSWICSRIQEDKKQKTSKSGAGQPLAHCPSLAFWKYMNICVVGMRTLSYCFNTAYSLWWTTTG